MRSLLTAAVVTVLALAVGCSEKSPLGGPGNTGPGKTDKDNTFNLTAPATATDIKQGETKEVKVDVNRGKNFNEDVKLKFEAPKGISVSPASMNVKPDEKTAILRVEAAKDAPTGECTVDVVGQPEHGNAVKTMIKVKIEKAGS
jgi:uncharacterized membrane protein